jgi:phage head maturation protease
MTSEELALWPSIIRRAYTIDDAAVQPGRVTCESCSRDATGRMVDAYIAPFNEDAEVNDEHGHYIESIDPSAWNKRLADLSRSAVGIRSVGVYYHHGMTMYGTPSEVGSVPIGHPSVIRADGRGLFSSTHYSRDEFADRILGGILDGNIGGQSFTGRIIRSDPDRIPRVRRSGELPRVRRLEFGLAEYGPTPVPVYAGTPVMAVRATTPGQHPDGDDAGAAGAAPPRPPGAGAEEPHTVRALRSAQEIRRQIRRFQVLEGTHGHGGIRP